MIVLYSYGARHATGFSHMKLAMNLAGSSVVFHSRGTFKM